MSKTKLIGYARRSMTGSALIVCLYVDALAEAEGYTGKDGRKYICLFMTAEHVKEILSGEREVAGVDNWNTAAYFREVVEE